MSFRSTRSLGTAVVVLLAVNIAVLAVSAVFRVLEMGMLGRAGRGELVTIDEALGSDDRIRAVGIAWIVLLILTGIVWLVWQHRSHTNLRAVGRRNLRFTPGWAVGWWFVPFANLVMPFQTVRELWKASGRDFDWGRTRTWPVLGWWWAIWIGANVVGRIAAAMFDGADGVAELTSASRMAMLTVVLTIAAAVLAILVVRAIVARQEGLTAISLEPGVPPPRPDIADRGDVPGP
jgi:hypothetical protein